MESFGRWGLRAPCLGPLNADERIRQLHCKGYSDRHDSNSMSSGSMSLPWVKSGVKGIPRARSGRTDWNWIPVMTMNTRMKMTTVAKHATVLLRVVSKRLHQ